MDSTGKNKRRRVNELENSLAQNPLPASDVTPSKEAHALKIEPVELSPFTLPAVSGVRTLVQREGSPSIPRQGDRDVRQDPLRQDAASQPQVDMTAEERLRHIRQILQPMLEEETEWERKAIVEARDGVERLLKVSEREEKVREREYQCNRNDQKMLDNNRRMEENRTRMRELEQRVIEADAKVRLWEQRVQDNERKISKAKAEFVALKGIVRGLENAINAFGEKL